MTADSARRFHLFGARVCAVALLLLAMCGAPSAQAASAAELLVKAKAAYDDYSFDKAAKFYKDALQKGIKDPAKRDGARLYYAFSLFILGNKKKEAQRQLRELFAATPEHTLNEPGLHPDLEKFYRDERAQWLSKHAPPVVAPEPKAPPAEPPAVAVVASPPPATAPSVREPPQPPAPITAAPAATSPTVSLQTSAPPRAPDAYAPAHWAVRLLPLGVGQFANGDPVGGAAWLSAEVALIALHVTGVVLQEQQRIPGTAFYASPSATSWWYVRTIGGAAAIAVAVAGVVDAMLWSPGRAEARARGGFALTPFVGPHEAGVATALRF